MFNFKKINNFIGHYTGFKLKRFYRPYSLGSSIFTDRELCYSSRGFWFLQPMLQQNELDYYYKKNYWSVDRNVKRLGANSRDYTHYLIISKYLSCFKSTRLTIVNFGAGHGGFSYLCWLLGHNIINIEPSGLPNNFSERWTSYPDLTDLESDSIDFFYSSHTIEHVSSIDTLFDEVRRICKFPGNCFVEVPNGDHPSNGASVGKIHIPHTYYFQSKFFLNIFSKIFYIGNFDSIRHNDIYDQGFENFDQNGPNLRVLGSLL